MLIITMLTFEEICEKLKQIDEISLLEQLNISSEDIVERFFDIIKSKLKFFQQDFSEDEKREEIKF